MDGGTQRQKEGNVIVTIITAWQWSILQDTGCSEKGRLWSSTPWPGVACFGGLLEGRQG